MARERATAVLRYRLDDFDACVLADAIIEQAGAVGLISWEISDTLPEGYGIDLQDQLEASKRDAGADACYMTVWMVSDDEI